VTEDVYGLIEMAFSFGGILAFLFWQLFSVRRSMRADARKPDPDARHSGDSAA
jgi:hypothetical protein